MSEKKIEQNMLRDRAKKIDNVTDEEWEKVNSFNRELVEEFLFESVHLSQQSLKQYRSSLRLFYTWVENVLHGKPVYKIKKKEFMRYQNSLVRRGMSSSGIKFKRSAVSSMNNYLINFYEDSDEFETFRNFVTGVPNPSPNRVYDKVALTVEEVKKIKEALMESEEYQILAAFSVMYASACRRSEFIQLKRDTTKLSELKNNNNEPIGVYKTSQVRGKGSGEQGTLFSLFLDQEAIDHIKLWIEQRGDDGCEYIFVSEIEGEVQQINTTTVNYWFTEIISDIVGRRVNPHIVRASRSTHLIKSHGGKLNHAQKLLNHKSSEVTANFYDLNEDEDEIEDMFE